MTKMIQLVGAHGDPITRPIRRLRRHRAYRAFRIGPFMIRPNRPVSTSVAQVAPFAKQVIQGLEDGVLLVKLKGARLSVKEIRALFELPEEEPELEEEEEDEESEEDGEGEGSDDDSDGDETEEDEESEDSDDETEEAGDSEDEDESEDDAEEDEESEDTEEDSEEEFSTEPLPDGWESENKPELLAYAEARLEVPEGILKDDLIELLQTWEALQA